MKAEIVEKIRELSEKEKVLEFAEEFNELVSEFYRIQEEEELAWERSKLARIEAGEKPESIEKPVYEFLEEFKLVGNVFKEKKNVELREIKEREKQNLEKKRTYIAALKDLIQNEENIGRAIGRFRDIQEGWKEVGPIPRDKRQEIQKEFTGLVDSFQYNINIYKEIKDHDLNRNLKLKKELVDRLKALLEQDKIRDIEKNLHAIQDEWNSVGGTHQEEWEKVKEEYWEAVNAVYAKIKVFYEGRREQQAENIEKKKELIEKAKEVNGGSFDSHKSWKKATDLILELQAEWKKIGYGSKEENDVVWKDFRAVCDDFFGRKKEFYDGQNDAFGQIKDAKEKLIEEANQLKDSTDWKGTTQKILNLQKQWKNAGSAGPRHENKLWKRFREPIDFFFAAKEGHFGAMDEANQDNLKKKEELIEQIKAYEPDADPKKAIEALRSYSEQFAAIGHVPKADKDKIYKAYKEALDAKYEGLKLDKEEKERVLFQAKLDSILGSSNKEHLLQKERNFIRSKIDNINKEINQYETNLGFFANADENNPLFKNVMKNIEQSKEQIDGWKVRLKMIREAEKEAEKENE